MSKNEDKKGLKDVSEGYVPVQRGYRPAGDDVTGGHKPEKSERKPVNPPKKK